MTPIVIAFTPNYFIPASTLVSSVLNSSNDSDFEFICLVSEEIPELQQNLLAGLVGQRAVFRYLKMDKLPDGVYVDPRYSAAAEYRLLLPELLPEYEKVIYIDCDIIVRNDIAELYNTIDLADNLLAAVYEAPIEDQSKRWEALGCNSGTYINSGFLVLNLEQMRKERTSSKLLDALKTDYLEFPDQDALNIVCQGRILALPPYWNSIRTFWLPQYRDDFLKQYGEKDLEDIRKHGTIHYTGGKPWNIFSVEFDKWWKVYWSLPAAIRKQWQPNRKLVCLSKVYLTRAGYITVNSIRNLFRIIRH